MCCASTVRVGQPVPDCEFEVFVNEEIKKVRLSDYRGKWLAVIFYPADFTFVCPTELEAAADHYPLFQREGAEVLSVSTDTAFVHKAWHDASPAIKKIRYPMAADPSGKLSRLFDVYLEDDGLALRGSFVVDPDGVLQACEIHNLPVGRSIDELLRKVQAAKFVCRTTVRMSP